MYSRDWINGVYINFWSELGFIKVMKREDSKSLWFDFLSGIECKIAVPGKLEEYLSQNCRSHYDQLVKSGCFIDQAMLYQSD